MRPNSPLQRPTYDLAKAFSAAWRSEIARGRVEGGGLVRPSVQADMLVVQVLYLPAGSFDPDFLRDGPAHGRPLFTPQGYGYWADLNRLAMGVAQGRDARTGIAALILMPSALETARERLEIVTQVAA